LSLLQDQTEGHLLIPVSVNEAAVELGNNHFCLWLFMRALWFSS